MPDNDENNPGRLRQLLEEANERGRQQQEQIRTLTANNAVHEAQLGHLTEVQRGAMLHTLGDKEVTPDALKAAATALGFPTSPPAPPNPDPNSQQVPGQQTGQQTPAPNGQGQPQPDPNAPPAPQFIPAGPNSIHPDPREALNTSIQGLTEFEYAAVMAQRGGTGTTTFDDAMSKAQTKEEVLAAIRGAGRAEGLVLDSDLV